jgi:hypothetical protein
LTYLARKLVGPNGEFIGMIVGVIELRHIEQFFGSISIGKDVAIALFRSDGSLLARDPHVEAALGRNAGQTVLFRDTWSSADGEDQLASLRALTHYPIVVSVSTTTSAALAQWLHETKIIIGAVGLAAASIGAYVLLIVRQMVRGIRQSRRRLRGKKLELDTALARFVDVRFRGSRCPLQPALHGNLWCARRHAGARLHPFTPFERRIPPNRAPAAAGRAATWRAPHARRARYARRQANRPAA